MYVLLSKTHFFILKTAFFEAVIFTNFPKNYANFRQFILGEFAWILA